jgi:hypothetical protein
MKKKVLGIGVLVLLFSATSLTADFVNIPASAFKGWSNTIDYNCVISPGSYFYFYSPDGDDGFLAEVHLPDGVKMKNMRLLYYDNDAVNDMECTLWRHNMFLPDCTAVFQVTSSGASTTSVRSAVDSSTSPNSNRVVYNNVCTYTIRILMNSSGMNSIRLYGVTIEYE